MVKGFRSLSLRKELVDKVEQFIVQNREYKNLAEFVSEATRLRLEELNKGRRMDKKKIPRARAKDKIEDLHADDMVTGGQPWHKPRERKKKESA